eukprot:TRINITY_DN2107_c1_g1_i1.p1 TRINITY_DN2107_c1_g1~~TRINITY_DN2107_c1_g1_i1.p1  ORF type:complete len:470 (-),score=90.55 TRINITY_DN2107_c1_g1_i1:182-1591(-)
MVRLAVSAEIIRRVADKMCRVCDLDIERKKTIQQLLSNMTRVFQNTESVSDTSKQEQEAELQYDKYDAHYITVGLVNSTDSKLKSNEMMEKLITELGKGPNVWQKKTKEGTGKKLQLFENVLIENDKWDTFGCICKVFKGHTGGVLCTRSDDTRLISGSCDRTLKIWNIATTECLSTLSDHTDWVSCLEYDDTGESAKVISGSYDHTVRIWDIEKGHKLRVLKGHTGSISCLGIKDKMLVSGSHDSKLIQWDSRSKKQVCSFVGHNEPIMCLCFDEHGHYLVSGSRDTTARVWDLRTGKPIHLLAGHNDWVQSIQTIYPSGKDQLVVSASADCTAKIWDIGKGQCVQTLEGHTGPINQVYPNNTQIFTASKDNTCRVWDRKTGKCKRVLIDHKEEVTFCLPFLQNTIVTGSYDATLKIWGPSKAAPEYTLTGHNRRISTLHLFDGNKIVSGSWDTTVRLWEFEMDFRVK